MLIGHIVGHVDTLIDLRRLQTFVTVSEQGTVSKAASLLHITQPALSRQLRDLQDGLGISCSSELAAVSSLPAKAINS